MKSPSRSSSIATAFDEAAQQLSGGTTRAAHGCVCVSDAAGLSASNGNNKTVVALLTVWWQVLREEATRLRTEPDFDVRLVSDLGITEGRRMLRYAVLLAADAPRTAHGAADGATGGTRGSAGARARSEAVDLEPGQELGLVIECPAAMAAGWSALPN